MKYKNFEYTLKKDGTAEITAYHGSETDLHIPAKIRWRSVTSIGAHAFRNCTALRSVCLPAGITTISNAAFADCTNITHIEIPDTVTKIDDYAFKYCSSLQEIFIPDSVTEIGSDVFYGNRNIRLLVKSGSAALRYAVLNMHYYSLV